MTVPADARLSPEEQELLVEQDRRRRARRSRMASMIGSLVRANRQQVIPRSSSTRHYSRAGAKQDTLLVLVEPAAGFTAEPA